jgi:hypothetical protein
MRYVLPFVFLLAAVLATAALFLVEGCSAPPPSRQTWELDPQGHGENLGAAECIAAGRTPYYIYPDGSTRFYLECLS